MRSYRFLPLLFFCGFSSWLQISCQEADKTPRWQAKEQKERLEQDSSPNASEQPAPNTEQSPSPSAQKFRFLAVNLKNHITPGESKYGWNKAKPAQEIKALVSLYAELDPHVLGICEIGKKETLLQFQKDLKEAGLHLPHYEHSTGSDQTRHLALLSKYPIVHTNSKRNLSYQLNGKHFLFRRGILDATVNINEARIRFIGVHLKSKRPISEANQADIRLNEAHLLRKHINQIIDQDPQQEFILYGDFNDTVQSKTIRKMRARKNSRYYLKELLLKDTRNQYWTHFWKYEHIYSRIDFIFPSQSLSDQIDLNDSRIIDDPRALLGSDHRPLLLVVEIAK